MSSGKQLRVFTLTKDKNNETTLFRLEKGWTIHFVLDASLAAKKVRIFVNHPEDGKHGPNRYLYRELAWQNLSGHKSDVYDNFAEVYMVLAGSFNYYFTINGSDKQSDANGKGYFLVDPSMRVGQYDERLPLDCIMCQTFLTKSLGPLSEWKPRLQVAKESGYNMVHFTPLQELGLSNSSYALKDQLRLNPIFCPPGVVYSLEDVRELVEFMKEKWDVLSLTDLVFNHTANESPWIQEHPECVYNVVNSPHLKPAYLMDRILWHFTLEVADGKWTERGIPTEINHENHLNAIHGILLNEVIPKHDIHEYYIMHIDNVLQQFRTTIKSGVTGKDREGTDIAIIPDPRYRRLKAVIDFPLAIKLYNIDRPGACSEEDRINKCCDALRGRLDQLNGEKYREIRSHIEAAVTNVRANAAWRFLDPSGPKVSKVSAKEPIMFNYFILPATKSTLEQEEADMETEKGAYCMAHNGWVMSDDPLRNFAEPGSNIYLRRELIPWGDSVKLRYGEKPEDCPYLWEHMREYTVTTARVFHGIRLDNCHSTPIHVAEYMLDEARKARPELYVIAELFTSSEEKDNVFINRLGISSLIREALSAGNSHEQGRLVHRYGGFPVGAFIQPPARPLVPSMAHALFMDQTHDNASPKKKKVPTATLR